MHPSLSKRIARVATALEGLDKPVVAAKSSDSVVYVEHNNKYDAKTFNSIAAAKKYINDIDTGYGQGRPSSSSPWVRESGKRKNKQGELVEFEAHHGGPSNAWSIYKETPVKSARLKSALAEGKGDKLPTEINLDKATPKRIAPIVNNVDGRLKNIDKYTDALVTALEAKKPDKVKSVMKSLKTQIDALHKWLMQDVTRLVTASSKASYRQGEVSIRKARTAYAKANQFLVAVKKPTA